MCIRDSHNEPFRLELNCRTDHGVGKACNRHQSTRSGNLGDIVVNMQGGQNSAQPYQGHGYGTPGILKAQACLLI